MKTLGNYVVGKKDKAFEISVTSLITSVTLNFIICFLLFS